MQPKILLATPISNVKSYILFDWLKHIKQYDFPLDFYFVDNSKDIFFRKRIEKMGFKCDYVSQLGKTSYQFMAECQNKIRDYVLDNGYDFLFSNECDVFPPYRDIVQRLVAHKKAFVGATYYINLKKKSHLCIQLSDHTHGQLSVTNLMDGHDLTFIDGNVHQVFSCGLGCALIHKSVSQKIDFRYDLNYNAHADTFFAQDLYRNNIPIFVDTGILCRHFNQSWSKMKA